MNRTLFTRAAVAALLAAAASPAAALADWSEPETLAAGSISGSRDDMATTVAINAGHVAVAWRASEQSIASAVRPQGAQSFGSSATLASETSPARAVAPGVTVGPDGRVDAVWGISSTTTSDDAVRCASRLPGASFTPCAAPLFDAVSNGNWSVGGLRVASNGAGSHAVVFEGPGSAGYDFSRPYAATRALPDSFTAQALDGNIGILGAGMPNAPRVAVGPNGHAVALWRLTVTFEYRPVKAAYRAPGAGWTVRPGNESIVAGGLVAPGDYDVAVDGSGDGWVITRQANGMALRAEHLSGAYATSTGGTGWGPGQDLGTGSDPQIETSSAGAATASWTSGGSVWIADRPAGDSTTFGAPVAVAGGVTDGWIDQYRLLTAPNGATTVAWIECTTANCATRVVRSRTRPAGAQEFGPTETVRSGTATPRNLQGAIDGEGNVALVWQEGDENRVVAAVRLPGTTPGDTTDTPAPTTPTTTVDTTTTPGETGTDTVAPVDLRVALDAPSRLTRARSLTVRVRNTGNRALTGTLALQRRGARRWKPVARAAVEIRAGASKRVVLRLDRATLRVLARRGRVVLRVAARLRHVERTATATQRIVLAREGSVATR